MSLLGVKEMRERYYFEFEDDGSYYFEAESNEARYTFRGGCAIYDRRFGGSIPIAYTLEAAAAQRIVNAMNAVVLR